jgi:polyphenol oxidase
VSVFAYRETWEGDLGDVEVAFSDSATDFGDQQGLTQRDATLAQVAALSGSQPVLMHQVHGSRVHVVEQAEGALGSAAPEDPVGPPDADGLVTARPGTAVIVRVADCVPVLLADPVGRIVGAAHAGRVGLAAGVIPATLLRMRALGAHRIQAWVGPHICGRCYEVPAQMRDEVAGVVPQAYSVTSRGTPALDLGAGVISQLEDDRCAVTVVPGCTYEDPTWHSFRRTGGSAGRMAGVIWMTV